MNKLSLLFGTLIIMFAVQSCDTNNRKSLKPRSIGNTSEVLVVLQNSELQNGQVGHVIEEYLEREQYGLMQPEPLFDLAFITVNNFSEMFQKHRNILIVEIKSESASTLVEAYEDRWSSPQRIIKITSPSKSAFVEAFPSYSDEIIKDYSDAERDRILSVFRPSSKNKVTTEVAKTFNMNMTIPQGFYVAKKEPGFMWIRKEVTENSQGLVIISEPYVDKAQFSVNSIIARTNRELLQYVPGPSDGSYMKINGEFIEPSWKQVEGIATDYTIEVRGVWDVENDFMGGPMVSYTFADPESEDIITIMGYVYNPNKKKRNLLRQMEAIIYSTQFREKKNTEVEK